MFPDFQKNKRHNKVADFVKGASHYSLPEFNKNIASSRAIFTQLDLIREITFKPQDMLHVKLYYNLSLDVIQDIIEVLT